MEHHIGQVIGKADGDQTREMEYIKVMEKVQKICAQIKRDRLTNHPLIKGMSSVWSAEKLSFHFQRLAEREITKELVRISLVDWLFKNRTNTQDTQCVVLIERTHWYSYVEPHAQTSGIKVIHYLTLWKLPRISKLVSIGLCSFQKLLTNPPRTIKSKLDSRPGIDKETDSIESNNRTAARGPVVAISYWHRTLDLDPTKRSEFFWLEESGIPYSNVLLYEYESDKPISNEVQAGLTSTGIRVLGKGPGVTRWKPTPGMLRVFLRTTFKLAIETIKSTARLQWVSFYILNESVRFASYYSYWYDFYRANDVKIDVAVVRYEVAKVLALESLNGTSVSYQYTVGSFYPTALITCGENIQFTFSPLFEQQFHDCEAPIDNFVSVGFIYDSALQQLRSLDRISEVRKQLTDKGAEFILCFFDENSVPFWDNPCHDDGAILDYEFLFNCLLTDSTLGLVFKPKDSTTLFTRISPISGLIERAMETGRCHFLTSDTVYGSVYPAEAALIADVTVGKLLGGSAAFESGLAGVPSVLVNIEHRSHPFYSWGKNRVIFEEWSSLKDALKLFRNSPESHPEFGDWSPGIDGLDQFRDGQASVRMGKYIGEIYKAIVGGATKEQALATAADWYTQSVEVGPFGHKCHR